jgi:hypothetical protein
MSAPARARLDERHKYAFQVCCECDAKPEDDACAAHALL